MAIENADGIGINGVELAKNHPIFTRIVGFILQSFYSLSEITFFFEVLNRPKGIFLVVGFMVFFILLDFGAYWT